jgi:plasmid stabilization system protein ParE
MISIPVLPAAQVEYEHATDWYLERSVAAATRFVANVESAIESIRAHPEQYPRWDDQHRFCLVEEFPYYIAYRHDSEKVVIVAIRHAARDQEAWKGR